MEPILGGVQKSDESSFWDLSAPFQDMLGYPPTWGGKGCHYVLGNWMDETQVWYVNGGGVCKPSLMGTSQLDRGLFL